ncbi:MAG TPA: hypothetical protein VJ964_03450 [Balneolaceae bacterium]|nr:hypothetical protein [Balneolaceae bacterium]
MTLLKKVRFLVTSITAGFVLLSTLNSCNSISKTSTDKTLNDHWQIQSSARISAGGQEISSQKFDTTGWYSAQVPGTVLASLVQDSIYKNIFFDQNMKDVPTKRFNVPWWYRTEFNIQTLTSKGQTVRLRFNGINYRADIWFNGHKIASSDSVKGGFRRFTFDVSDYAKPRHNVLALKVTHPKPGEPTLGFVDWNPAPPDHNMGIWRKVHLMVTGPVSIDQPFVKSKVDTATLDHADLTIESVLTNHSDRSVSGKLSGSVGKNIMFSQPVQLDAGESKKVTFNPNNFPQLGLDHPRLWWVHTIGKPNLYDLHLTFVEDRYVSDRKELSFGIRSVSDYITKGGHRGFKLNGKKILIKGGGWTDPMLLNASPKYEKAGIDYAMHMNLNTIRMEGFWGSNQHLYNLCDRKGLLIMVGWSAQWEWDEYMGEGAGADQFGGIKSQEQMNIAAWSWKDQITWLRNHPSIFLWLYGSDKLPRPEMEKRYLDILHKYDMTRPFVGSAAEHTSSITGPTAVKMRGPYDYVPPDYWYIDKQHGGAFGFNTETGPGPQIPRLESLKKMIPTDSLWPISQSWLYHAARHQFHNLKNYNQAMDERLGKPESLDDYLRKAQYLNYEGMRAMLEAFEANRYKSTGIIQWMYNASWPKLWWQFYDYYLNPTGAFYGARKANEPVHIAYNYGRRGIDLMNNTLKEHKNLTANIRVLNFSLDSVLDKSIKIDTLPERKTLHMFDLPENLKLSQTYFLDLNLKDQQGNSISSNFYALSTQKDLLNESGSTWYITPESQFADLTELQNLQPVKLQIEKSFSQHNDTTFAKITLRNPSDKLAFMTYLNLVQKNSGKTVVPIFWDDNYITLLPGEERSVTGYCHTADLEGQQPEVTVEGWNVK